MNEKSYQFPRPARLAERLRFKWGQARVAALLLTLATGLGVLAWTSFPDEGKPLVPSPACLPPASKSLQEILAHPDVIPTHHHALLGRQAPDFELADSEGKLWKLTELRDGRPMVVIFHYGYHCIQCARQLSDVNRDLALFEEVGARVVAISDDPPELTSRRFQQHGAFGFPLLSDPGNKTAEAYEVFQRAHDGNIGDIRRHGTFAIDRNGVVQWVNVGDGPLRRTPALLYQLAKIGRALP